MTISLNPTESYIDESIYKNNTSLMSLSFQLSLHDVSFCITENSQGNYLAILSYAFTEKASILELVNFLEQLAEHQVLLKNKFSIVTLSYKNDTATLIPSAIYDPRKLATYLSFTGAEIADQNLSSDFLKVIDAYNVYAIPQCVENVMNIKFPSIKFIHHSTVLIQSVFENYSETENTNKVFVNIHTKEFELAIIKQGKLSIYNSFHFKMKEDFLYYLLFAMKQFDCDPATLELILMGKIAEQSSIHQLLVKYIANVNFAKISPISNLKAIMNEEPEHYFFTLLNIHKCE